jgi:hypothetical protein
MRLHRSLPVLAFYLSLAGRVFITLHVIEELLSRGVEPVGKPGADKGRRHEAQSIEQGFRKWTDFFFVT